MSREPVKQPQKNVVGMITRMFPGKGYGFVRGPDGLSSFANAVEFKEDGYSFEAAREGHTVKYDITYDGERGNGQRARNVRLVSEI
jgi:hypothetical protein